MQRRPNIVSASLLMFLVLLQGLVPMVDAQTGPPPPTPQELDQLLAPIALYPDALLAQITTASTNPQEVLDVTNWLAKNPSLTGTDLTDAAQKQGYDPAFIALVTFPDVLQMMSDNIDDYAAIGMAVTANQTEVADSIQRLRAQAYASGALRTSSEQKVEVQQAAGQTNYVIEPANPQVVYVPIYDPTVVYVPQPRPVTPFITFGLGIGISALYYSNSPWGWGGWGWGWGGTRVIYYNRGPWGGVWVGGYRPPVVWYRPRPIVYNRYPGYGGNWGYRPPNYRPPRPSRPPIYRPPGKHPANPGYRPPPNGGRPGINPPTTRPGGNNPGRPTQPSIRPTQPSTRPTQPSTRPTQPSTRPTQPAIRPTQPSTRPTQPSTRPTQPAIRPTQPSTRPTQPSTRPTQPANRPAPQSKPAPQSGPANPGGNRPGQGPGPQPR